MKLALKLILLYVLDLLFVSVLFLPLLLFVRNIYVLGFLAVAIGSLALYASLMILSGLFASEDKTRVPYWLVIINLGFGFADFFVSGFSVGSMIETLVGAALAYIIATIYFKQKFKLEAAR